MIEIVNIELDEGVARARFRIVLYIYPALDLRLIELQMIILYLTLIEAVIGELPAIGRPPDRGALSGLLTIDPTSRSILDAALDTPIGRDLELIPPISVAEREVTVRCEV